MFYFRIIPALVHLPTRRYCCLLNLRAQVLRLSLFANWFESLKKPPTAIIDGPNAAYMDQNHRNGGFTIMQARPGGRLCVLIPSLAFGSTTSTERVGESRGGGG